MKRRPPKTGARSKQIDPIGLTQRQVVCELLPEIMALRMAGVGFDQIAAILRGKGMKLRGDTLRQYYFREKSLVADSTNSLVAKALFVLVSAAGRAGVGQRPEVVLDITPGSGDEWLH